MQSKKIRDLADLFKAGKAGGASNSTTNGEEYHLFGHRIARVEKNVLIGNWCGYPTATTQRHLSNIAAAFSCDTDVCRGLSRKRGEELGLSDFIMKDPAR